MAAQYLLPCECGSSTPIDTSQAGSTVACNCGQQLEVPSLRAIRQLTPHSGVATKRKAQWNPTAGMVFVGGLILALLGGGAAFFMHLNARYVDAHHLPSQDEITAWVEDVDNTPPALLLEEWNAAKHVGLGEYEMSPVVQQRALARNLKLYRNTSLIVMASGLVFAASSIFLRRKAD